MSEADHYDTLVLGSGEGGKFLAWHRARQGLRVAVVERRWIGGACPNTNCLPSKNEIWSAKVADLARRGGGFGVATGPVAVDMAKVVARKRRMVDGLVSLHLDLFAASGAELVMGSGRLTAPRTLDVALNDGGTRHLTADRLVLNLGTRAAIPDIPGLAASEPLTHVEALDLDRLPDHLVVIGGGYVGLEMGQAFRRFGSAVTVIEPGPQLAGREDPDVGAELLDLMHDAGVTVHLETRVLAVEGRSGGAVRLRLATREAERTVEASDILVAAGRTPNTGDVGLDRAGVEIDARGFIAVDHRLRTSAADTWAIGDAAGSPQFTHVSFDDFRVVRGDMEGEDVTARGRLVPYCMFTDPPLARVGPSAEEARRRGLAIRVARVPTAAVLRSRTLSETRGFLEAVIEADGDRILGFTMIGPEAGEVMAVVQTAMVGGLPYTALRDMIIAHPTMAEGLVALFSAVPPPQAPRILKGTP